MTGLTTVLLSGLSGLRAAQTSMGVTSNNIANANTPATSAPKSPSRHARNSAPARASK
jgi:flagellar basal body rod protein FlgC